MIKAVIIGFQHMHVNETALYLNNQPSFELVGAADSNSDIEIIEPMRYTAQWNKMNIKENFCSNIFDDYIEMLDKLKPDVAFILSENSGKKSIVEECAKRKINVIIDTAGDVPYDTFKIVNDFVDTYFFDVKSGDKEKYKEVIGGNLDRIKENLFNLIKDGKNVRIRIPVIPNFNDSEEEIKKITLLLKDLGVTRIDLLPFHRLGSSKYKAMDKEYKYAFVKPFTKEEMENIANLYRENFTVKIEK